MALAPCTQLVVVGSSAGGIAALSTLVSTLPEDFPAPIVIAQHLDPERESSLQQILSNRSTLPVRTVSDHEPLEDGVVFVVPANQHINITDSHIGMRSDTPGRPKPSVDLLLGSAAEVFGERLIAVVLTGTGTDGTNGARSVSERGGTVVIQNPDTADFRDMPSSLAPNTVDVIANLDEIVRILVDLLEGLDGDEEEPDEGEREEFERLLGELREVHGVDFGSYKESTIMRRLKRRMAATARMTVAEYRFYLAENLEEYRNLVSSFLIKVTQFFRDPEHFGYLKKEVLPGLVEEARQSNRGLRIWSAGCATGEEAYSLAIALSEVLGDDTGSFNAQIFATDLDPEAVAFARRGVYPASSVQGLSEGRLERHFDESEGRYQVKKSTRSMIVFGEHDLSRRSPFPNVDLCVSRNVLIYFAPELQKRALLLFAYSLRDGGALVLGKAETVSPLSEYFVPESRQYKVYRRQGERFLMPSLPSPPPSPAPIATPTPGASAINTAASPSGTQIPGRPEATPRARDAGEEDLARLPMGVVVVDRGYDIKAINAPARRMLSIYGAAVGEDFLRAIRGAPYAEVRAALDAAFREDGPSSTGEFSLEDDVVGESRYLRLNCYPRRDEGETGPASAVLVAVNDVTRGALERREMAEQIASMGSEMETLRREARAETSRLRAQNERLVEGNRRFEEINRELGDLNEGLQRAYEESPMASEEAQAATEEIETLNEELQATNEELETLNEELQATIEELNTTNEDLQARSAELQEMAREREEALRAEAQDARRHFWNLISMSRRFASSMRSTVGERHQQKRRLAAQYAISQVLVEARDLDEAAPKIWEVLGERLGWHAGVLWKAEREAGPAVLRCADGWRSSGLSPGAFEATCEEVTFRRGEGLPGRVWERCEPVWVENFPDDGEAVRARAAAGDGLHGALAFPIVDGEFVGVFELFRREALPPDEDLIKTARLVGGQIAQFLERRRAEEERDRMRERERKAHEQAKAAEHSLAYYAGGREERQIISRELHDRVAHSMAVVRQNLELFEVLGKRDPAAAARKLELAKEEATEALKATRDLSMMLRRSEVEGGLRAALGGLRETTVPDGIGYEVFVRGEDSKVPPHVGNQVFLILREAVRNAVTHSGCGRVEVRVEVGREEVVGTVQDDGQGFEPGGDGSRRGVGLRSMHERAALVGGTFELSSAPDGGIRVEVRAPLASLVLMDEGRR